MLLLTGCPLTKVTFVPQSIAICNIFPQQIFANDEFHAASQNDG